MSSIAALATRRALTRQSLLRAPPRRFNSSKMEQSGLDKAPKRDPELYVWNRQSIKIKACQSFCSNSYI